MRSCTHSWNILHIWNVGIYLLYSHTLNFITLFLILLIFLLWKIKWDDIIFYCTTEMPIKPLPLSCYLLVHNLFIKRLSRNRRGNTPLVRWIQRSVNSISWFYKPIKQWVLPISWKSWTLGLLWVWKPTWKPRSYTEHDFFLKIICPR